MKLIPCGNAILFRGLPDKFKEQDPKIEARARTIEGHGAPSIVIDAVAFLYLLNVLVLRGDIIPDHQARLAAALESKGYKRYMNTQEFKGLDAYAVCESIGALKEYPFIEVFKEMAPVEKDYVLELAIRLDKVFKESYGLLKSKLSTAHHNMSIEHYSTWGKLFADLEDAKYFQALDAHLQVLRNHIQVQEKYPDNYFERTSWYNHRLAIVIWLELNYRP